jgi:DNA-binding transcriptional MerR regulator
MPILCLSLLTIKTLQVNISLLMHRASFTKTQAAVALEISARTIQFYTDQGLLVPEVANPSGRGTTRKYSRKNLVELLLIRELAGYGLPLEKIKAVMKLAQEKGLDKKWDPESKWAQDKRARLIIYNPGRENMKLRMEAGYKILLALDDFRGAWVINIEDIFIQIDELK